jgi:predicted nucleotidyltransferase
MRQLPIDLPHQQLADFCRRWKVSELGLFGSVLGPDFRPDSDVDFLVSFAPEAHWTLLDWTCMEQELRGILGRPVDLVSRRAVERSANPIRRRQILESAESIYVAR